MLLKVFKNLLNLFLIVLESAFITVHYFVFCGNEQTEVYIPLLTYLCSSPEEAIHIGIQHSETVLVTVKSWDIFSLMCFFECPSWSVGKWQRWWRGIMWEEMPEIHKGIKWRVIMWVKDLWLNFGQGSTSPDNTRVKFERLTYSLPRIESIMWKVGRNIEEFTCSSLSVVVLFLSEATCLSPSHVPQSQLTYPQLLH